MILAVKALVLVFVISGVGAAGASIAAESTPMDKAIDIHEKNLKQGSTLPTQSLKGQQTALDHLVHNQERWLEKHGTSAHGSDHHDVTLPEAASDSNHGIGSNPFSMGY